MQLSLYLLPSRRSGGSNFHTLFLVHAIWTRMKAINLKFQHYAWLADVLFFATHMLNRLSLITAEFLFFENYTIYWGTREWNYQKSIDGIEFLAKRIWGKIILLLALQGRTFRKYLTKNIL